MAVRAGGASSASVALEAVPVAVVAVLATQAAVPLFLVGCVYQTMITLRPPPGLLAVRAVHRLRQREHVLRELGGSRAGARQNCSADICSTAMKSMIPPNKEGSPIS